MSLAEARADAGLDFKSKAKPSSPVKIMDLRPSKGLATGLKRIGGRSGISRLGRETRENIGKAKHGRPIISHRF
jgi:hypothetical protein